MKALITFYKPLRWPLMAAFLCTTQKAVIDLYQYFYGEITKINIKQRVTLELLDEKTSFQSHIVEQYKSY